MLGTFKGSSHKALEVEAAVLLLEVKFEKACNNYSLRILLFHRDHPIKQALYQEVDDELQEQEKEEEDLGRLQGLQLTTQLMIQDKNTHTTQTKRRTSWRQAASQKEWKKLDNR